MPLPRIAIVGRPNVGKSSIMNMLAKGKVAIVDPTAGTTRDRVSAIIELEGPEPTDPPVEAELTDTGGYGAYTVEGRRIDDAGMDLAALSGDIEFQIAQAIGTADLILLVIDAQAGVTPMDEQIARMLREGRLVGTRAKAPAGPGVRRGAAAPGNRAGILPLGSGVPVLVVANKTDGPRWESHAAEAAALGLGEPLLVSAKNNYLRRDLIERLYEVVKGLRRDDAEPQAAGSDPALRLAIIGKRNAGKSQLVNTLAGEPRVIVSEIAGTTRDAVDVRFDFDGRTVLAIDTAGLRKKKSFQDRIEHFAFDRVQRSVERADVVLLMIDATVPLSQVDEHLAMLVQKSYKPVIICVNKWDLAEGRRAPSGRLVTTGAFERYLRRELGGIDFAPIAFLSGLTGRNVRDTIELAFELRDQAHARATTGKLNRLMRAIVTQQGPANKLGTFAKVFYVAQVSVAPPTIVLVVNKPELFKPAYKRFLLNRLREEVPFPEVPIRLEIRARKRDEAFAEGAEAEGGETAAGARRQGIPWEPAGGPGAGPAVEEIDPAEFFEEAGLAPDDADGPGGMDEDDDDEAGPDADEDDR